MLRADKLVLPFCCEHCPPPEWSCQAPTLSGTTRLNREQLMSDKQKIHGLDYARAIFSIFVVLWHFHVAGTSTIFNSVTNSPYSPSASDIINFNVFLQAVPFFILASCYLYAETATSIRYLGRRIVRIGTLIVFWAVAYHLFYGGADGLIQAIGKLNERPVYQTVTALETYSFFVGLLISVVLSALAVYCNLAILILWVVLGSTAVCYFQWQTIVQGTIWTGSFWNPLNYVAYPAAAALVYRLTKSPSALKFLGWASVILFIISTTLEWRFLVNPSFFPGQGYNLPAYTRLSSMLFVIFALILCLKVSRPAGPIVQFMSRNSLGLYCIHPFLLAPLNRLDLPLWVRAVVAIAATYAIVIVLRRFFLREEVLA